MLEYYQHASHLVCITTLARQDSQNLPDVWSPRAPPQARIEEGYGGETKQLEFIDLAPTEVDTDEQRAEDVGHEPACGNLHRPARLECMWAAHPGGQNKSEKPWALRVVA